jgi:asparagine synthase (glutamine-hydrolysing)
MCGIFGFISADGSSIPSNISQTMTAALQHRGPDHTGRHQDSHALLGTCRLAIIDIASGNQPIYNKDKSLVIVFNGEIYNHRDLRARLEAKGHIFRTRSDTEVLLCAFEEYGPDCVTHLDGMFAFAIWNQRQRTLFMARDRMGIKPLYTAHPEGGFAFASEPRALLGCLGHPPRPDWTAMGHFFSLGYFPLENCAFEGIRKFPAGHFSHVANGRLTTTRYWKPSYGQGAPLSLAEAARRVSELSEKVVEKEMESDVPVGVFLSGGLDSSLVALQAQRAGRGKVPSFSLGFEEDTHDESVAAEQIAETLGLEHHPFRLSQDMLRESLFAVAAHMDEPFGDSTVLPLFALSRLARDHVKVALTGWGGDELFGGYPTYKAHRLAALYRQFPSLLAQRLIPSLVERLPVSDDYMSFEFKAKRFVKGMDRSPEEQHFLWMSYFDDGGISRLFRKETLDKMVHTTPFPPSPVLEELHEENLLDRIMHLDALTFLEGNGLFQADRVTMAASLEARVPLLNREMVDFVAALPVALKMHGGQLKAVLKETLRPHLPPHILRLPKKGFGPPSSLWLRCVLGDVLGACFSQKRVEETGLFDYIEVQRLIDEHHSRKADHGRKLWLLLSYQLWHDRFIHNCAFPPL